MSIVTTDFRDATAVVTINNPPVNTGNTAQRTALAEALSALAGMALDGVVIASGGRHFYAGSDLREFDAEVLAEPQLPDVIGVVESLPFPVVAAITGLALGGGFELALGCDARIADPSAGFGFPEVNYGMLPGAGGSVRVSRLVGVPTAIELVTSARQVMAEEALALGLVEAVVPADQLLDRAVDVARRMNGKARLRDRAVPDVDAAAVEAAIAALPKRARPNVRHAAETVVRGATLDVATALAEERASFHRFRLSEESRSLRYLFFAKQHAAKALKTGGRARPITTAGIVGAGTMGAALARALVQKRLAVIVVDSNAEALTRLPEGIATASTTAALSDVDLVIEAVFEDMAVKQALLKELEPLLRPDAVIVSNTSYLDLEEMSQALSSPDRFAGLHFFNPPDRNPLVEIIRTASTDEDTAATLAKLVGLLGKVGIPAGVADGFVGNRIYSDYRTQAEFCVEEGASPAEVDAACVALGIAMGPFAVGDMSGLDIAWARRKVLAVDRDPEQRYVDVLDRLYEAGRLGRKTGTGWYRYPEGAKRGEPDPAVEALIAQARAEKGVQPRTVPEQEIQDRILGAMVAAAAVVVRDGVARRASHVDVALTEGFAFPKWLGGPVRALARRPREQVIGILATVHRSDPFTFAVLEPAARGEMPAAVAAVLDEAAG
ncbi:MAG: 3-hydroxyacyl-CoA dehydrogenase, NAD-binding [Frankiales bacterium]|jgi:3-hydroxyacyl-CoA dehydrogenase|nr:3-hydroxyacyl-CoA dehydrogenase, NAD-binding [Frankiales bacterium]